MLKGKRAFWTAFSFVVFLGIGFLGACVLVPAKLGGKVTPTPAAMTSVVTEAASLTKTPLPLVTITPQLPSATPGGLPSATILASATPPTTSTGAAAPQPYRVQMGSPKYLPAFTHPEAGCNWLGVAGQIFGSGGAKFGEMSIMVYGDLDGKPYNQIVTTSASSPYGPRGYEITLTDLNPGAAQAVEIQLFDSQGKAISDPATIQLPSSCDKNLILVNFQPNMPIHSVFLPSLQNTK